MQIDSRVRDEVSVQPHPLLFATISGSHLYGFPSPDSPYDLRGVHLLPLHDVLGLEPAQETIEVSHVRDGLEIDLVTHDARKFFGMVLKKNGYVLEQIFSPLVVQATPEFEELRYIAEKCVTRHHAHHYIGFASSQWKLFSKESPRRVRPLLEVYRVLLTGIHLMRTGEVEASLSTLNEERQLPFVPDLIARLAGPENPTLPEADLAFHEQQFTRLSRELEEAFNRSRLPELPEGRAALNDLLIRLRLGPLGRGI